MGLDFAGWMWARASLASTIEVPGDADSLVQAVEQAHAGDEIVLGADTFVGLPDLAKPLIIRGQGADLTVVQRDGELLPGGRAARVTAEVTLLDLTLDGADEGPLLQVQGQTLALERVRMRRARGGLGAAVLLTEDAVLEAKASEFREIISDPGGAVAAVDAAEVHLTDCAFLDNETSPLAPTPGGAALRLIGTGASTVTGGVFLDNIADVGGAVLVAGGGLLTARGTRFERNRADVGGAIATLDPGTRLDLSDVLFLENEGTFDGGAVHLDGGTAAMIRPLFCRNRANGVNGSGGAVRVYEGALTVTNGTFLSNEADDDGTVRVYRSSAVLDHCTFVGNSADQGAGAAIEQGDGDGIVITHSILANNVTRQGATLQAMGVVGISVAATGFWNNAGGAAAGQVTFVPPVLAPLTVDPFPGQPADTCPEGPLIPSSPEVLDQGTDRDLDGSPGDLGATGGPQADPALWEDCDGDGLVGAVDADGDGECLPPETGPADTGQPGGSTPGPPPQDPSVRPPAPGPSPGTVGCGCQPAAGSGLPLGALALLAAAQGAASARRRSAASSRWKWWMAPSTRGA